eukprot:163388-Ditylum_brightwellii.AAC.1
MKLWETGVDLQVLLREWNMVASSLDRHWSAYYNYSNQCIYIHLQNTFIKYKKKAKKGTHSPVANPHSGFQTAYQFPFTLQHQMERLRGKGNGVGVSTNCQNNQSMAYLPHT